MRRVLVLAYHFPPIGGGGVQRNAKFVRYLRETGYDCIVVTGSGTTVDHWTPRDETLLAEIPQGTEVHRVPGPEPPPSQGWRGRSERVLLRESPHIRWWIDGAVKTGQQLKGRVDLIYASLAPYETAIAASRLAERLGTPWVADLQDPWVLDELWFYPTGIHRRRDLRRMRTLLARADAVVLNCAEAERRFRDSLPELRSKPVVTIPNGFDHSDFADPPPPRGDETFRIVHTGYLYTKAGRRHRRTSYVRQALGGSSARVDVLTRTHVHLLEAIHRLLDTEAALHTSIELHLAGVLADEDLQAIRGSSVVHTHGYLTHGSAIALMRSADLLFLPMHDVKSGQRVGIVPGKTYEYLASGRPILAAVPAGDARDLLQRAGTAFVCRPGDVEGMARIIRERLAERRNGAAPPLLRQQVIRPYDRPRLTAELAAIFDSLGSSSAGTVWRSGHAHVT